MVDIGWSGEGKPGCVRYRANKALLPGQITKSCTLTQLFAVLEKMEKDKIRRQGLKAISKLKSVESKGLCEAATWDPAAPGKAVGKRPQHEHCPKTFKVA